MTAYQKLLVVLFILFFLVNVAWLHRVPGLMGDEASEGQNVYELLERDGITLMGERSYIGPLIDYVRVPFIWVFGYTSLAVRAPIFLASLATFLLAASVLRKWFGDELSLFPLIAMTFSPVYLTHQRLGWAITLFPFFLFLIIWLSQRDWKYKWIFVGLAAGVGLHTHIMFAPTLVALGVVSLINNFVPSPNLGEGRVRYKKGIAAFLLILISFWAGFATQFVVLQLNTEDQGDPVAVGEVWTQRLADVPSLLPVILSGSSYVAHYTGVEFSPAWAQVVAWTVLIFALFGIVVTWRNKVVWLWLTGLAVHLLVLLYMIDRFSLRYFLMFTLGMYVLAGLGVGQLVARGASYFKRAWVVPVKAVFLAGVLSMLWVALVLVPFLRTGGGVGSFSLGNRVDSASALVDMRSLLTCLRGAGTVGSENVHIFNRLLYLSHEYNDLVVMPEEEARSAQFLVHYRQSSSPVVASEHELCPALTHFIVEKQ